MRALARQRKTKTGCHLGKQAIPPASGEMPKTPVLPLQGRGRRFESVNAHQAKSQVSAGYWPLSGRVESPVVRLSSAAQPFQAHSGQPVHGSCLLRTARDREITDSNPVWLHNDQGTAFQAISNGFERWADGFGSLLGAPSRSTQKHDAWLGITR